IAEGKPLTHVRRLACRDVGLGESDDADPYAIPLLDDVRLEEQLARRRVEHVGGDDRVVEFPGALLPWVRAVRDGPVAGDGDVEAERVHRLDNDPSLRPRGRT